MNSRDNLVKFNKLIIFFFLCFLLAIISFLVRWQYIDKEEFTSQAAERYHQKSVSSIRGDIQARDGTTLAYSEPRYDVFAYLPDIENAEVPTKVTVAQQTREEFIRKVSTILNTSSDDIITKLGSGPRWVKLASKIKYDMKEQLENLTTDRNQKKKLVGLNYEFTSERLYPEGILASHLVGFMGKDLNSNDIGRGGMEQYYEGVLEPQEGYVAGETDKYGNLISLSDSVSIRAKRGSTVKMTIDKSLQQIIEQKLEEGVKRYEAVSGSIIIMNPQTGEILALANYPDFNPAEYYKVENVDDFGNKAISVPYEVGSVAKVITIAAAVEELGVTPDEIISQGHNGCRKVVASNEKDFQDICTADRKPQGPMTATQALINSDNLAFVNLSERLGKQNMYKYITAFGGGQKTQVDLSGESVGPLPDINNPKAWHPVDLAVFSFGHGYQMNLLQITRAYCSVANRGWIMQPYIVSEIIDSDKNVNKYNPLAVRKVISKESADTVIYMMNELYKSNASQGYKHLMDYPIASKSGTALIPYKDRSGYSSDINATYIGFDTSENSKFVMALRLEAPQNVQKLSFYSARPLWFETFDAIKDHVGIKKVESGEE